MLRFSPYAWAKLLFLRDLGDTEVGGFAIASGDDLLLVEDLRLIRQRCSPVTVTFDDEAVADFFDDQVDQGRELQQVGRIWVHTHPGNSAEPSGTDEATFARCFGRADWALMFILARGGQTYARLRFNVGPGGSLQIPVEIEYGAEFAAADWAAWEHEYFECVRDECEGLTVSDNRPTLWPDENSGEPWGLLDEWQEWFGHKEYFREEPYHDELR